MNFASLLNGTGSIGFFSSRIFLPAFITALALRFGGDVPLLHHLGLLGQTTGHPIWFTNNITLILLGILSVLEILAQKNPEARQFLHEFDMYLKAALAALTSLGVMSATDASFVQHTAHQANWMDGLVPIAAAIGTFRAAIVRNRIAVALFDHVEGTHFEHLVTWLEDAWVLFGVFFLILFPIVMLVLIGIVTAALFGVNKRLEVLEERSKIPCHACGAMIYASAIACPRCKTRLAAPVGIGFFGQSKPEVDADLEHHAFRLTEKRRCSTCATRLPARRAFDACPACGSAALADSAYAEQYVSYVNGRLPVALGICLLLSFVPILGLIAGVVYYRMVLVLPFSQYLPMGRRFLLRWGIRLLLLLLLVLQIVPVLGALAVPLMALVSFTAYRSSFRSMIAGRVPTVV